jgi:hypothetical protein
LTPVELKFDGARQLGEQLLGSCELQRCMSQVFLQRALGVERLESDAGLEELTRAFVASGLNLRELFALVTASQPFLAH